jgi:phosphoribosyl-ATP pyrophosphohydrolase/phosphoribosyl-AMP cyclohydrolase
VVNEMVLKINQSQIDTLIKKINFKKGNNLIPVIVQDASNNKVLMQAFMNQEALKLTLKSGKIHFWSRTRKKIWLKGEESEHFSLLQNMILDCDNDAILFKVQQIGAICHTGKETCFHKPIVVEKESIVDAKILERIFEVIVERIDNPNEESYVSNLTIEGEDAIIQKIGEETIELVLALKKSRNKEIIHETTDLLFHILVMLAKKNIKLQKIFEELGTRHQIKTKDVKG